MEANQLVKNVYVRKQVTDDETDKEPSYRVVLRSGRHEEITVNMVLLSDTKTLFALFPKGTSLTMTLRQAQATLDQPTEGEHEGAE